MREQLLAYALRYEGSWPQIAAAIRNAEPWQPVSYDGRYVTVTDADYPARFRQLRYPPWVIFYAGNSDLWKQAGIAVIGARSTSAQGRECCRDITSILKEKYVIISGLAKGIDAIAHKEALDARTLAVIGCGIDVVYPRENAALYRSIKERQLIISEYPSHAKPFASHFPWRNRLIAALADAVVVIEAKERSGTMHTVNEALELSRPIYCAARSYLEKDYLGNALLLSQGAQPLWTREDVKEL